MAIYECLLVEDELAELDTLIEELTALAVWLAQGEYDSWQEAEAIAAEVNEFMQRSAEVQELLFEDAPIPGSLLLALVEDLQFLAEMADVLQDLGYTGMYRLKRRAERMIGILDESCIEI